ncbi:MAG TPA: aminoglycoside phosphotransferase family protein [Chloroflexota bacterium]|nr:aminoglycoside phosphotransferase family protein [Chloroflexota bacterium]
MAVSRMHADEMDTDVALVRRLVAGQFPQWGDLTVEPVRSAGTVHAIYRLGPDMVVRLPRVERATSSLEKEIQWLPRLAPHLPLAVPLPLASGVPAEGYPWRWAVYRWLDGETATRDRIADPGEAAIRLARFVAALHGIEAQDGPPPGEHNWFKGERLANRDDATRRAIAALDGMVDVAAVTAAWEAALVAPAWDGPGVWVHGDLLETNLLARDGRLSAVIDFGCLAVGDPACDVMTAWAYLPTQSRAAFRAALSVDDATWARGRGWALSWALIALPYYKDTNPGFAAMARRTIAEVLADHTQASGEPA